MTPFILVVDDEADIREIAAARLKVAGFRVETVESVKKMKEAIARERPTLILLDIQMPETNGTEAIIDAVKTPLLQGIKIAFFTNLTMPWPGIKGPNDKFSKELGAAAFIDKAKELDTIGQRVAEIIGGQ